MAVQDGPTFKRYVANGVTTVFAIPFLLLDAGDLVVTLDDVPVTSGFTLTGIGDPSSTATFTLAPTGDLLFRLVIPFQRLFDYQENGDFLASTVNDDFDRIWQALKELRRDAGRALSVPESEPEGIAYLPEVSERALKLLSFDSFGNPVAIAASNQSATDLELRLADQINPDNGAGLVGYKGDTVAGALDELSGAYRHLRSFGVVGDGVTNDSAAMAVVAAHSGIVVGEPGMVVLTDGFIVSGSLKLNMGGGSIKMRTAFQRITINSNNVEFYNTVFDGGLLNVNVCFIRIPTTYTKWLFDRCTFQNITGVSGSANQYGIYADLDGTVGLIKDCTFTNISNVSNGTPTSAFCGGILLIAASSGSADLKIDGVRLDNIFCTGIAGNVNNSDADGIRAFGPTATVHSNLQITRINSVDVQKSAIKTSGLSGLVASDINVYNNRSDVGMVAGLRFQAANNSVIKNINLTGRMNVGINIRSRNIIVDGINFSPIDAARDVVAGGLIQLQSDDSYITERVKVSNVVATNVTQAFDFDTSGTTLSTVFQFIEFHHWDIKLVPTLSAGIASKVKKATHVILDHVYVWYAQAALINAIEFTDVSNFKAHHCRFESRRELFVWSPGCNGIEFDACSFYRQDIATSENLGMLVIRDTSNGNLDRVVIRDCTISCPTYSSLGNQHAVRFYATNSVIDGLYIFVRGTSGNVSPPAGWVVASCTKSKISDVKVSSDVAITNSTGGYAVDMVSSATLNTITDIHNSTGPGVRAFAGANDNLIDTVAGKVTAVVNSGTGNTVGSQHVLP